MEIIDSKFSLFLFPCMWVNAGLKTALNGNNHMHFIRNLERTPF